MAIQGTATIDFGATPVTGATFTISDAGLSGLTYGEAWIMADSTANNTIDDHRQAGASFRITCDPPSGTNMAIEVHCLFNLVTGQFKVRYVAN